MPIPLRSDFDAFDVRAAARRSKDGPQARRLLALAAGSGPRPHAPSPVSTHALADGPVTMAIAGTAPVRNPSDSGGLRSLRQA
jgi:hypothetical protein